MRRRNIKVEIQEGRNRILTSLVSIVGIAIFSEPLMLKFPNELSRFSISVWLS